MPLPARQAPPQIPNQATKTIDIRGLLSGGSRYPVGKSPDLTRVAALPFRDRIAIEDVDSPTTRAIVALMTQRLRYDNPNCKCAALGRKCILELKPAQAWALFEAPIAGGLIGPIGVGHGKTGLDLLISMVMPNTRIAALLVPPSLLKQIRHEYAIWSQHFRLPSYVAPDRQGGIVQPGRPIVHVIPYSRLSLHENSDLLERLRPDLIIADEAQKLRHRNTAGTGRVLRYFAQRPDTRLCAWSGTLTSKSLLDYTHLAAYALKDKSPCPIDPNTAHEWSLAIDPSNNPSPEGALRVFREKADETVQQSWARRLHGTQGVVGTRAGAVEASIYFHERHAPKLSKIVQDALAQVRGDWIRPDGEELVDEMSTARVARQLSCGFYYRWKYPRGEPEELIREWFQKRKDWHRELRGKLQDRLPHLDSELLVTNAAIRALQSPPYTGPMPVWRSRHWAEWRDVRDKVQPETEAVWLDDSVAKDAAEWAKHHRGIVWYEHTAFGEKVAEIAGLPIFGAGTEKALLAEKGDRSIVCSIQAHGTGRDGLQRLFNKQLVTSTMSSGAQFEQLLGRLHRIGQEADEVETWVYRHTPELRAALDMAIYTARYIEDTMQTLQKLLAATLTWEGA